jgi:tape measure domain-containing protein
MTDIELRLTADVAQATKGVAGFSKQYRELVNAIEKPLKQIGAFRDLESNLEGLEQKSRSARDRVRDLGDELASAANPSKALTAAYKDAVAELQRLTRAESLAQTQLAARRRELQSARIDTSNLVAAQKRLAAELGAASLAGRRDAAIQGIRGQSAALGQLVREQRKANLEQARADFGITRARQYENALVTIRQQYALLRSSGNLTNRELAVAQRAYTQRVNETRNAMSALAGEQKRLRGGGSMLPGLVSGVGAAYAAGAALKGIAAQADAYNLMNARLKLATSSQEEFTTAQTELGRIAQATQSPVASLVTLYGRISRPLKEAGRSQADILKVTEAVATSFRVSGATAEESKNGVIQFAQALGAGALRGDEFNSVAEQAPRLMQALAASIGVPVGALKEMATQGLLTADVVSDALVSQLEVLRKEADTLPETVGGAMTALADQWNKAIGQADVQPLIDAINELSKVTQDPGTTEGLISISGAITRIAAGAIGSVADLGLIGDQIGLWAAQLSGGATELDKINKEIKEIQKVLSGAGLADILLKLFFSDEELKAKLALLEKLRAKELEQQSGQNAELQFLADVAAAAAEAGRKKEVDANTKYIGDLKALQEEQVKAVEKQTKALVAAEKKAVSELEKVKKDRLDIEKRYSTALSEMGGTGDASYSSAQALKVGARNALRAGDVESAQTQARAALKMLQDLAAAGENTYGFEGFIRELEAIDLAANDIEQSNAQAKIEEIKASMAKLKEEAKKLENMPLSIKSDEASIEAVRTQITALVAEMGQKEIVLPVRVVHPGGPILKNVAPYSGDFELTNPRLPGLATGGWTGPGSKYQPAGIVHADEHVQPKRVVNEPGALSFLEQIRRNGFRNTISQLQASMASRLAGYAEGGYVSERSLPAIPAMNPALLAGPGFPDLGRVAFELGGESVNLFASPDEALNLQRLAAKFGRTRP